VEEFSLQACPSSKYHESEEKNLEGCSGQTPTTTSAKVIAPPRRPRGRPPAVPKPDRKQEQNLIYYKEFVK